MKGSTGTATQILRLSSKEKKDQRIGNKNRKAARERRTKKRNEPGLKDLSKPGEVILVKKTPIS